MTQIVHTTVINYCTECPNCILHDPHDGDVEAYCNAVKTEIGATFIAPMYNPNDILQIPSWCPLRKGKK